MHTTTFQFRLRSLFILVPACALACCVVVEIGIPLTSRGTRYDLSAKEKNTISALEAKGISIGGEFTEFT